MLHNSYIIMRTFAVATLLLLPHGAMGQTANCTICPDGTASYNESKYIPGFAYTCKELEDTGDILEDGEFCGIVRNHAAWCECPGVEPTCSFCPNGAEALDADLVVPYSNSTCRDLHYLLSTISPDDDCDTFEYAIDYCCGESLNVTNFTDVSECTICPDGATSYNTNKIIPGSGYSCGQLESITAFLADDGLELCDLARSHASWCECPGVQPSCAFCPIGMEPTNPDLVIPDSDNATCGDLHYASFILSSDDFPCDLFLPAIVFCGDCTPTENNTTTVEPDCSTLCPDGSNITNPDLVAFDDGERPTTCGEVEGVLALFNPFETCDVVWYIGVSKCMCEDTLPDVPEGASCTLCQDGSAPENLSFEVLPDTTCKDLGYFISEIVETECTAIQATAGVYCGCDNDIASQDVCRICSDSLLPETGRIGDLTNQTTCIELEFAANFGEIECTEAQASYASICCSGPRVDDPTSSAAPIMLGSIVVSLLVGAAILIF